MLLLITDWRCVRMVFILRFALLMCMLAECYFSEACEESLIRIHYFLAMVFSGKSSEERLP